MSIKGNSLSYSVRLLTSMDLWNWCACLNTNNYSKHTILCSDTTCSERPFLIHRTNEVNPYCGLGVCGEDRWKLVLKINGSKVIRDCNNQMLRG